VGNNVVAALADLQDVTCVEVEVPTSIGYRLDAVVVFQGNRIGVEVDGPSHYVGRSESLNGATLLKHRQLRALVVERYRQGIQHGKERKQATVLTALTG
jgi:RAP domain